MITWVYGFTVLMYFWVIVMCFQNWKFWEDGFTEQNGSFASKYYRITFHVMRSTFVLVMLVLGFLIYKLGEVENIF